MTQQIVEKDPNNLVLTTIDNPYDPKLEYEKWRRWDVDNGYHTEEFLARVLDLPADFDSNDDVLLDTLTTQAQYEIIEHDMLQVYMLV